MLYESNFDPLFLVCLGFCHARVGGGRDLGISHKIAFCNLIVLQAAHQCGQLIGSLISRVLECRVIGKGVSWRTQTVPRPGRVHPVALVGRVLARMRLMLGASAAEFIWWRGTSCERVHSH